MINSFKEMFSSRQKNLAVEVIRFCASLPKDDELQIIRRQLISSITSVGANYRAACRAKSRPDFINKLLIVEEEADESIFWFELLQELIPDKSARIKDLKKETNEILSMIIKARQTARQNQHS